MRRETETLPSRTSFQEPPTVENEAGSSPGNRRTSDVRSDEPLVSVILLTYNSQRFVDACLSSIFNSTYPRIEVILIDNGSQDKSVDTAQKSFGHRQNLRVVQLNRNIGFAAANNLGASIAKGDLLVFLNIDTETEPNWLNGITAAFATDSDIAVVQPKILLLNDHVTFDSAGDYIDYYGSSLSIGGDWNEVDTGQYTGLREIFSARGAALSITKKAFTAIGGFDPDYFLDFEDIDLCWRARLAGHKVYFTSESVVYHASSPRRFEQRAPTRGFHPIKNRYASMIKNLEIENIFKLLVPDLLLFFIPSIFLDTLLKKNPRLSLLKVQAMTWLLMNLGEISQKRQRVQNQIRKVSDSQAQKFMLKSTLHKKRKFGLIAKRFGVSRALRWYARPLLEEVPSQHHHR